MMRIASIVLVICLVAPAVQALDLLTLRSMDGQDLRAYVTGAEGDAVMLQREDRRKFTVPLTRFDIESQQVITGEVLKTYEMTPVPALKSVLFEPRWEDPRERHSQIFLTSARSGDLWWSRLHIGNYSEKTAEFASVVFENTDGNRVEITIPENVFSRGRVQGGKTWTAAEFSVDDETLRELALIAADPRKVSGHGVMRDGSEEPFDPSQLTHLGSSVAIFLRAKVFAANEAFQTAVPGAESPGSELPIQALVDDLDSTVAWNSRSPSEQAEEISGVLETQYKFWSGVDTGMEYFVPSEWGHSDAYQWKVTLMMGRRAEQWRPALWLYVPTQAVFGRSLERIRVFVDDEPGFALNESSLDHIEDSPDGVTFYTTSFHAGGVMGVANGEILAKARRIRFELLGESESVWVEAKPEEVDQIRESVIGYRLMKKLHEEKAPVRPLL